MKGCKMSDTLSVLVKSTQEPSPKIRSKQTNIVRLNAKQCSRRVLVLLLPHNKAPMRMILRELRHTKDTGIQWMESYHVDLHKRPQRSRK